MIEVGDYVTIKDPKNCKESIKDNGPWDDKMKKLTGQTLRVLRVREGKGNQQELHFETGGPLFYACEVIKKINDWDL